MRLWSIHPKYLDRIGLVALWREGLLAKKVLEGKTKGYKKHPQLDRFLSSKKPVQFIDNYLHQVLRESEIRGYNFDESKINPRETVEKITISRGQIDFEFRHLQNKLAKRDCISYKVNLNTVRVEPNLVFDVLEESLVTEGWEKNENPRQIVGK